MALINITGLTFAYDGAYNNVFEDVNFQLDTNWKLGFIGRNGRGKTTFLKLLMGEYDYKGKITADVNFEYFPYKVGDKTLLTSQVVEEIYPEFESWQLMREFNLLELAEGLLHRPFETLSGGEQTKVLLAVLFLKLNTFLLIDEPTNHLDSHARQVVADYLKTKSGFILISHDRDFLDHCVDHILSINRANIEVQRGNFSTWQHNKELNDEFEFKQNEKLKKEVDRLQKNALEKAKWADKAESRKIGFDPTKTEKNMNRRTIESRKSKKMMKRAKTTETRAENALEEKQKLLKNIDTAEELKISQPQHHSSRYLYLNNLGVCFGSFKVFEGVSFTLEKGERAVVKGRNGSGKSTLLKLICGEDFSHNGQLNVASGLKISYVSQDTSFLNGTLTKLCKVNGIEESRFKTILRKLGFDRAHFEINMEDYSEGQKKKVLIAKSLCENAHMLVWDEPLNYIDVISRMQIESLLLASRPTILFVEHDNIFTQKIATKMIEI